MKDLFVRWPRLGLAARTALSATLAWVIALNLPGSIPDTYPYFAPLGAVVGSYSTVHSSVRNSAFAVGAIISGALLSLAVAQALGRDLFVIPFVVFLATLLAGWKRFGGHGSWVLSVAVFVLVAGAEHPVQYALGYCTMTLLGGTVAVLVNSTLPSVPLARSGRALHDLTTTLADQLADLADGLRRDSPPSAQDWEQRLRSVAPVRESLRTTRAETEESLRGNVRARTRVEQVRRQHIAGVALENTAVRVEELTELLVEVQAPGDREVALEPTLRTPTAQVLDALAASLRDPGPDAAADLRSSLRTLTEAERGAQFPQDRDRQTAGAVVTALRRCLGALELHAREIDDGADGPDAEAVPPTPWRRPAPGTPAVRRSGRGRRRRGHGPGPSHW